MSVKKKRAGLVFSWQKSFSILSPWRKGTVLSHSRSTCLCLLSYCLCQSYLCHPGIPITDCNLSVCCGRGEGAVISASRCFFPHLFFLLLLSLRLSSSDKSPHHIDGWLPLSTNSHLFCLASARAFVSANRGLIYWWCCRVPATGGYWLMHSCDG